MGSWVCLEDAENVLKISSGASCTPLWMSQGNTELWNNSYYSQVTSESFGDVLRTGWIGAWKAMGTSCWCFLHEGGPLRCEFVCPSLGLATEISPALPYGHVLPLWYAAALTCFDAEVSLEGRVKKFLHVISHFILKCLSSRKLPFVFYIQ